MSLKKVQKQSSSQNFWPSTSLCGKSVLQSWKEQSHSWPSSSSIVTYRAVWKIRQWHKLTYVTTWIQQLRSRKCTPRGIWKCLTEFGQKSVNQLLFWTTSKKVLRFGNENSFRYHALFFHIDRSELQFPPGPYKNYSTTPRVLWHKRSEMCK